jgi:MFS family permease
VDRTLGRSLTAVLFGTFTLRFSTGLTGAMLVYYLAELPRHGGQDVDPLVVGALSAAFFVAELALSPPFGVLSDHWGQRPVMQLGPGFGAVAVILTGLTTSIPLLGVTRLLEGGSTAASVPSILGYIARATADDEPLRGRIVARFELATLAGLGIGMVAAGPLFQAVGPVAFFINAGLYGGSWLVYRFRVLELPAPLRAVTATQHYGLRRYWKVLTSSHVWLLAPTWIAVNAAIGLWTSQSIFQLVKQPDPRFADQLLMGGFSPLQVSVGLGIGLLVFFAGILYWGGRFKNMRRTTILFYGVGGGMVAVACAYVVNHSAGQPAALQPGMVVGVGVGLFVLAGATPAALGLLADISESYPNDRGAIMGLYSVFLALGQITGSLIGGEAAHLDGIDGILVATLVLVTIALLPLYQLRSFEHRVGMVPAEVLAHGEVRVDPSGSDDPG